MLPAYNTFFHTIKATFNALFETLFIRHQNKTFSSAKLKTQIVKKI